MARQMAGVTPEQVAQVLGLRSAPIEEGRGKNSSSSTLVVNPPTLRDAFVTLCLALQAVYEDNEPAWLLLDELLARPDAGHGAVPWRQVLLLLEGAVGAPIRGGT